MRAGGAAVVVGVGCVVAQLDRSQIEPTAAARAKSRVVCMTDPLVILAQSYSAFSNCDTHSRWRGNLIVQHRGHNFGTGRSKRWCGGNRQDAEARGSIALRESELTREPRTVCPVTLDGQVGVDRDRTRS